MPRRTPTPWRALLVFLGAFFVIGCGDGGIIPGTIGPVLVCPAAVTVTSVDGKASPVAYEAPSLIGGEPPIKTSCVPPSGSTFPLGGSTVTCTATDSVARTGTCSFRVTVVQPATIADTGFMAFGNSITEGKLSDGTIISNNYPEVLRGLLASRYTSQNITMANKGFGGEYAVDGARRFTQELDAVRPDAVLLEEGINDLSGGNPASITPMIEALRTMVREGQRRGVTVFLATLTPVVAGSPKGGAFPLLPEANDRIRILAQNEHATLVDLYVGFSGIPGPYIGSDGLHPNALGYQKIGEIFYDRIRSTLESPVSAVPTLVRNLGAPWVPVSGFR